jgi:hypothetical protein
LLTTESELKLITAQANHVQAAGALALLNVAAGAGSRERVLRGCLAFAIEI